MTDPASKAAVASARFQCIAARAADAEEAERVLAEAVAAGAAGAEQRDEEDGVTLLLYAPAPAAAAVARAAAAVIGEAAVAAPVAVEPRDWSEAWKSGLRPIEVSERLRIRPSFDASLPSPRQRELVIDPGQAFGTGGHESTWLALAWIDALREELPGEGAILDVGTGTGVLALAALALGARRAVGFDIDPLAAVEAAANARANRLDAGFAAFTGPIEAIAPGARFAGIAANLLRRELEPVLGALASRLQPGGWLVISGLLESEGDGVATLARASGLDVEGSRAVADADGTRWTALLMRRRRGDAGASRSTGSAAPTP